tara:strand:+ start:2811 stop:4361 length:1551 start_codon:yes stop_codon:yes gene_type:complete
MELILIWMTGAFFVGQVFRFISLPPLAGFILSGYLFTILGMSDDIGLLEIPAEIGVELLLFSIGLKIRPSAFLNTYLIIVVLLHTLFITMIFFLLSGIDLALEGKIIICMALSFSSTVIATKSLESRKELTSFHGRLSVLIIIFQDIIALLLLGYMQVSSLSFSTLYLLILPVFIPIIKFALNRIEDDEELLLLATLIISLLLGSYVFKYFGLTGEIGALVLGILLSGYSSAEKLSEKIWSLREILLLAFFISIGMQITITNDSIGIFFILMSLLIAKSIALFILLISFKLRSYTSFLMIISLATFSEFSLIVLSILAKQLTIDSNVISAIILSVSVSFVIASILNKHAHKLYEICEKYLIKIERKTHHPDEEPHTCGDSEVMILGLGRFGGAIFDLLNKNKIKSAGFDSDTVLVKRFIKKNRRAAFADAEDPGFWSKLRFGKLRVIILALPEYEAQKRSIIQARKYGFNGKIIVPSRTKEDSNELEQLGADIIFDAYEAAAIGISESLVKNIDNS